MGMCGVWGKARSWVWPALLAIGLLQSAPAIALPEFPELTGRVVDEARVLRSSTESAIAEQLRAHEAETSNQVVVVTVRSLQGYTIEEFGVRLGIHWGIGQRDRDNGVLLIVAPNERKVRIEVGLGLEGVLTDSLAKIIIDEEILPLFRRGHLERGVRAGADSILSAIAGTYEAPTRFRISGAQLSAFLPFIAFGGFGLVVIFIVRDAFRDGGWRRDGTRSRDDELNAADSHWDDSSGRWERDRHRSNRWTGGFGGGGSGGGGFSGGGGSFGGGGSSGSW